MKVVVTGATGFLGKPLVATLLARGDEVTVLTRDAARARSLGAVTAVEAPDIEEPGPWTASLANTDAIVHLAGESIGAKRWDARQKQILRDSRVESTRTIVEAIAALPADARPRTLICASGTDYYGFAPERGDDFDDDEVTENDPPGESFLSRLCRDWEREATNATQLGLRVAVLRNGLVLGPHGGAVERMTTPFKFFIGGRLGSGRQFMSWIHLADAVTAYANALVDDRYSGAVNVVAASTRNAEFSRSLGNAMGKPSWLPVPAFALKLAAGELSEYLLHGRNVVPARLRALGFTFTHATLDSALRASL